MGLAGASIGAFSGVIVSAYGYPTLALGASLATAPVIVLVSTHGFGNELGAPITRRACDPGSHAATATSGASSLYITGVTIRASSVLEINPPIITQASGA